MCFKSKQPKAPPVQTRPEAGEDTSATKKAKQKATEQSGVFGNIFTSALGDSGAGSNVVGNEATKINASNNR